ncbi:MAG: ZIP family metal transporter [Halobacteriaceae archaeon]
MASATLLVVLSLVAGTDGGLKLVGIGWVAFVGMTAAAGLGVATGGEHPRGLVWGYGLASGAMITSAAVFLVPQAIGHHAEAGGFGIAAGLLAGFGGHTIGHRILHYDLPFDRTALELTAHALAAGVIIGVVYEAMPTLGPLLGLAIVSHKGPAGYAAARRFRRRGQPVAAILVPASALGVAALVAAAVVPPLSPTIRGAVFGMAAGIFLHVAMDFLPRCETGSEVHAAIGEEDEAAHARLDALRIHAVVSTALGAVAVLLAWATVTA